MAKSTFDRARYEKDRSILTYKVGECLMAWAHVEFELNRIFVEHLAHQSKNPDRCLMAEAIWASIVSFEARLRMLNAVTLQTIKDTDTRKDWALIKNYIVNLGPKRNQVAHGGIIGKSDGSAVLKPYFSSSLNEKPNLKDSDLAKLTTEFLDLLKTLEWLSLCFSALRKPSLRTVVSDRLRTPHLVQRLRDQAARSRGGKKPSAKPSRR